MSLYIQKGVCVRITYMNVNNEIIARDCSHKEFRANRVTLRIELRSFLPNYEHFKE